MCQRTYRIYYCTKCSYQKPIDIDKITNDCKNFEDEIIYNSNPVIKKFCKYKNENLYIICRKCDSKFSNEFIENKVEEKKEKK